jgi:hypothetical protein
MISLAGPIIQLKKTNVHLYLHLLVEVRRILKKNKISLAGPIFQLEKANVSVPFTFTVVGQRSVKFAAERETYQVLWDPFFQVEVRRDSEGPQQPNGPAASRIPLRRPRSAQVGQIRNQRLSIMEVSCV